MAERIYDLLGLNRAAGLGRRLAEVEVKQDDKHPESFLIISADDVVEALSLAYALSVLAGEILHLKDVSFRAARTLP